MSDLGEERRDVPGNGDSSALPENLRLLIERSGRAATSLRRVVTVSAAVCLIGSIVLALYWKSGGLGGVMKIGLAAVIFAGFVTVLLLGFTRVVLGRIASIETDVISFGAELTRFADQELADVEQVKGMRALGYLYRLYPKMQMLGDSGKELASAISKAALLGNPLVYLAVLALSLLGFALPLCGGLMLVLRFWWRARVGG